MKNIICALILVLAACIHTKMHAGTITTTINTKPKINLLPQEEILPAIPVNLPDAAAYVIKISMIFESKDGDPDNTLIIAKAYLIDPRPNRRQLIGPCLVFADFAQKFIQPKLWVRTELCGPVTVINRNSETGSENHQLVNIRIRPFIPTPTPQKVSK